MPNQSGFNFIINLRIVTYQSRYARRPQRREIDLAYQPQGLGTQLPHRSIPVTQGNRNQVVDETGSVFNMSTIVEWVGDETQRKINLLSYLWSRCEERVAPYVHRVKVRLTEHVDAMSKQTLNP